MISTRYAGAGATAATTSLNSSSPWTCIWTASSGYTRKAGHRSRQSRDVRKEAAPTSQGLAPGERSQLLISGRSPGSMVRRRMDS